MPAEDQNHDSEVIVPVRVGLIADGEGVQRLGPWLRVPDLEVACQSGMRPAEALPDVPWHDDTRAMIAQSGVEALILATSPRAALELEPLADDYGLPVWRLPPLARNFGEAVELARRLQQRAAPYRVASWWEAIAGDVRAVLARRVGFKPLFSRIHVSAAGPPLHSWRACLGDAPGGALATESYDMLEALLAIRSLPERVTASIAQVRRQPDQTPRETESVALAILHYESGASALVEATWDLPPFGRSTQHHGADASLVLEPERVALRGPGGEPIEERQLPGQACVAGELERFVATVRHPRGGAVESETIERHMAVAALVQAIYLSARTGQPESPRKFYEVQKWPEPHC